jgi:hypothetical protein
MLADCKLVVEEIRIVDLVVELLVEVPEIEYIGLE